MNSWNPLVSISWGRLDVERGPDGLEVRYHITFTEVVTFGTLAAVFMALVLSSLPGPSVWEVQYVFPVLAWAFVVGGTIAIALVRFPDFVRRWSIGEGTGARA